MQTMFILYTLSFSKNSPISDLMATENIKGLVYFCFHAEHIYKFLAYNKMPQFCALQQSGVSLCIVKQPWVVVLEDLKPVESSLCVCLLPSAFLNGQLGFFLKVVSFSLAEWCACKLVFRKREREPWPLLPNKSTRTGKVRYFFFFNSLEVSVLNLFHYSVVWNWETLST